MVDAECQTELSAPQISELELVYNMTCKLAELKNKILETDLSADSFQNNAD